MNIVYLTPEKVNIGTTDLTGCEQLLLWSIRTWVIGFMRKHDVNIALIRAFKRYNIPEACTALEHFMYCLSFGAKRTIDISCPLKSSLSPDELTLMNIFANYQKGHSSLATCMLDNLCTEKYLMQARYHALEFTDKIQKRRDLTLTCLKLTQPTSPPIPQENITSLAPSFAI